MKVVKKTVYNILGGALLVLGISHHANAQTCVAAPSCETLGYNKTAEQCSGLRSTKCPLDTTKYSCPDKLVVGEYYKGNSNYVVTMVDPNAPNRGLIAMTAIRRNELRWGLADRHCKAYSDDLGLVWRLPDSPREICPFVMKKTEYFVNEPIWLGTTYHIKNTQADEFLALYLSQCNKEDPSLSTSFGDVALGASSNGNPGLNRYVMCVAEVINQ